MRDQKTQSHKQPQQLFWPISNDIGAHGLHPIVNPPLWVSIVGHGCTNCSTSKCTLWLHWSDLLIINCCKIYFLTNLVHWPLAICSMCVFVHRVSYTLLNQVMDNTMHVRARNNLCYNSYVQSVRKVNTTRTIGPRQGGSPLPIAYCTIVYRFNTLCQCLSPVAYCLLPMAYCL